MRRLIWLVGAVLISLTLFVCSPGMGAGVKGVAEAQTVDPGLCGLSEPAFCETFDHPAGIGNRSGQLNGTLWGVSRGIGGAGTNFGQGQFDAWLPTQLQNCTGSTSVQPDQNVVVCDGQVREAVNDASDVTTLSMYPKQPFDFAGRTGIVSFDVSNDTQGPHTVWPEFWITDQPVPTPFTHFGSWLAAPRNGFGIRLAAMTTPYQGVHIAPDCPNDANNRWSVESVVVSRNYVLDDQDNGGTAHATMLDCVIASSGPGNMNHVEVHVSQNQIDIYATDAGTTAPLHHIGVVQNANLTFTRGLIWLEDAHYNADKFGQHDQREHTFAWGNVGFDGPVLPRDLTFDALDALVPVPNYPGQVNLGWRTQPGAGPQLAIPGVTGIPNAAGAAVTMSFYHYDAPSTITCVVNGHLHSVAWPYPDTTAGTWRTLAVPIPLSEVVDGTNTVSIWSDKNMALANVDILLMGAGGIPTPPGTASVSPADAATVAPTDVPAPTVTPTDLPAPNPADDQADGSGGASAVPQPAGSDTTD